MLLVLIGACRTPQIDRISTAEPTFNIDVAPILFDQCSACHRPGEAAPFSVLDYGSVRSNAAKIVKEITSGRMPPWLPAADCADFVNRRHLRPDQIKTIERWVET